MADETSQEEPSMEEILASIRRIISEDGEEEGAPAAEADGAAAEETVEQPVAAEAPDQDAGSDEVLELTEEVDDLGNVVADDVAEAPASEPEPEPAFEASEPAAEPAPAAPIAQVAMADPATEVPGDALMENIAEGAATGAFAALASQVVPGPADSNSQQVTPGGRTIEDHVLEMLRPMLREWLDRHLPQMVQRLVQREIDRIIHRSDPV